MLTTMMLVAFIVLACLVALCFIPVDVRLRLARQPGFFFQVRFRWLFGLVDRDLKASRSRDTRDTVLPETSARKRRRERRGRRHHPVAMLRAKGFLNAVVRFATRLLRAARLKDVSGWLRAGFDDPADTGLLCAWLLPLWASVEARSPGRLVVTPDFSQETLVFSLAGEVRLVPANLLWPALAFALSPGTLRGFRALRQGAVR